MQEKILHISENKEDQKLINRLFKSGQLKVFNTPLKSILDKKILKNGFPLILVDYDLVRDKASVFYELQKGPSKACIIFYGDHFEAEEVTQILQKGIYTIIPRSLLPERIFDAVIGGLENRKAFIEILQMMDELKEINDKLEKEKNNLRKRNQELNFINLLSNEISYDLNWGKILHRMITAGLEETLNYSLFGIYYSIGSNRHLALHLTEDLPEKGKDDLKKKILANLNDKGAVVSEDVHLYVISKRPGMEIADAYPIEEMDISPLSLAGKSLGSVFRIPKESSNGAGEKTELMETLANILSLSLKNAQEYHKLKEATVTDNLTGVYNRKGLYDFLTMEFNRAKRYGKTLSFVMIDMNDFKNINDSLGHQAGDYVLRELAGVFKMSIRQPDIVARYGGDEFAMLLPETTIDEADVIMGRVSENIKSHTFEWGSSKIKTSMSYGIANIHELKGKGSFEDLVRMADSRLYRFKNGSGSQ